MKSLLPAALTALATGASAGTAFAEMQNEAHTNYVLAPGESRTIYVSGSEVPDASLPVFKVCVSTAGASTATLHVRVPGKGTVYEQNEIISAGNCIFATGRSLSVSSAESPGAAAPDAEETGLAWLNDRVNALRAKSDRTDEEEVLLAKYRKALNKQRTFVNVSLLNQ
ncbi:MAG TPA: hypothetical protein PK417_09335 [Hyphomonas sp.]|nr:hypothetical protein [Hyphomonas sp.]HRX73358.1 hypothetical protein [Hyphomonas sp.]